MREVRLYGALGRQFGRLHRFDVATPAEAIRALCANFPGFDRAITDHAPGWHVLAGREDRADAERLHDPAPADAPIKIIPATAGSKKNGLLQTIVGVVLIVAGAYFGQTWMVQAGIGLALGGVAQMLTPVPKLPAGQSAEDQKQSYIFGGPVNTSVQGNSVPVGYGRMIIGSAVISMGLTIQELPT